MARGQTVRFEESSLDPVRGRVSSAAVRKVAEELTARAARLQHQARQERDRAERLHRRSEAATGRTGVACTQ